MFYIFPYANIQLICGITKFNWYKYSIALKEANETEYWLELLNAAEYIDENTFNDLKNKNSELIAMLVSSIKTSKEKIK